MRYLGWATAALRGDLGESWFNSEPVTQTILNRLPVTRLVAATGRPWWADGLVVERRGHGVPAQTVNGSVELLYGAVQP